MKKLRKILSTLSKKDQAINLEYHTFETITLREWRKVLDGNIEYCIKDFDKHKEIGNENTLKEAFHTVYDYYLQNYDKVNKKRDKFNRMRQSIANLQLQVMQNFDEEQYLINNINRLKQDLEDFIDLINKETENITLDSVRMMASKFQTHYITEDILAKDFYAILNNMKNTNNG